MPYSPTPSSTTVVEGNTNITFTITRSGSFPSETIYASTLFDTASAPGDYDGLIDQPIIFGSGQTSATFTVSINGAIDWYPQVECDVRRHQPTCLQ